MCSTEWLVPPVFSTLLLDFQECYFFDGVEIMVLGDEGCFVRDGGGGDYGVGVEEVGFTIYRARLSALSRDRLSTRAVPQGE